MQTRWPLWLLLSLMPACQESGQTSSEALAPLAHTQEDNKAGTQTISGDARAHTLQVFASATRERFPEAAVGSTSSSTALPTTGIFAERPRLLAGPNDKSMLLARLQRTDQPFSTLASRIRSSCNAGPAVYDDPDGLDQGAIYTNGNIARNCALLAWLEGNVTAANKARDILLAWPADLGNASAELFDNTDIHVGEALSSVAQAYDLLKATTLVDSSAYTTIENNILGMTRASWNIYVKWNSYYYRYQNNNHKGKLSSAFGMVAMAMNTVSDAEEWFNYGITELDFVLRHQSTDDGGFAEGPYYLNYGTETYLPFFWAYHRHAQGQTLTWKQSCDTRPFGSRCKAGPVQIDDFVESPSIYNIYQWWLTIMMPDGLAPDFDDANRGGTFMGVLAGLFQEPNFRAAWERNTIQRYYSQGCQDLAAETLLLFPDTLSPSWPGYTSRFLPEAGTGVFRSDWSNTARYGLLLAERGSQITGGHEHPDGTSLLIHAYGEYLVRDSGYGSWDQRQEVSKPLSHNILLVDWFGPHDNSAQTANGVPTTLERCQTAAGFEHCDARASFSDIEQVRTVYFVGGESFVAVDSVAPNNGRDSHSYVQVWHLNSGGGTGGTLTAQSTGAQVVRPSASLGMAVGSTRGMPVITWDQMSHGASYGVLDEHDVMFAEASGTSLKLATVFEPAASGGAVPSVKTLQANDGALIFLVQDGTKQAVVLIAESGITARATQSMTGLPEVVSNAVFAWVEFQSGVFSKAAYEQGTVLTVGGVSKL